MWIWECYISYNKISRTNEKKRENWSSYITREKTDIHPNIKAAIQTFFFLVVKEEVPFGI